MRVNVFGIVVILAGVFLVFLGVTGRYQVFTGSGTHSNSSSTTTNTTSKGPFKPFPPKQPGSLPGLLPPGWPFLNEPVQTSTMPSVQQQSPPSFWWTFEQGLGSLGL